MLPVVALLRDSDPARGTYYSLRLDASADPNAMKLHTVNVVNVQ